MYNDNCLKIIIIVKVTKCCTAPKVAQYTVLYVAYYIINRNIRKYINMFLLTCWTNNRIDLVVSWSQKRVVPLWGPKSLCDFKLWNFNEKCITTRFFVHEICILFMQILYKIQRIFRRIHTWNVNISCTAYLFIQLPLHIHWKNPSMKLSWNHFHRC